MRRSHCRVHDAYLVSCHQKIRDKIESLSSEAVPATVAVVAKDHSATVSSAVANHHTKNFL